MVIAKSMMLLSITKVTFIRFSAKMQIPHIKEMVLLTTLLSKLLGKAVENLVQANTIQNKILTSLQPTLKVLAT